MLEFYINKDLRLKLLEISDTERIYELMDNSREYMRKWLPWIDSNVSSKDSENFIKNSIEEYEANKTFKLGIWYKNELVGLIGVNELSYENRYATIGYWLGEHYQGKGIMTKSCSALIDYIFRDLKFNRVEIRTATNNYKSAAIPRRLGFKEEGIIRDAEWLYDHFVDHIVHGMLEREWRNLI